MIRCKSFVLIAMLTASPLAASGYIPDGNLNFAPLPEGVQISGYTGRGARGTWCAAADYAVNQLAARHSQKLYVSEPRARVFGHSTAVGFTLNPTNLNPSNVFIVGGSLTRRGSAMTISHALTFCPDVNLPIR